MSNKKNEYEHLAGYNNAWLDDQGNFFPVPFMQHNQWAIEYLQKELKVDFFDMMAFVEKKGFDYPWEYLCKGKGWIRLMNWTGQAKGTYLVGYSEDQKPTETQKDTLFLWCSKNGYEYDDLFEK